MDTEVLESITDCKTCPHWQDTPGKCSNIGLCPNGVRKPQQEFAEME